jgi:hypothetical protein
LRVSLRLWVLLACAATQVPASATEQNPSDLQCVQRKVAFDGVEPLTYATVVGDPGFRLRLYPEYPQNCSAQSGTHCKEGGYLVPGDEVAQAKTCASWSYIQFIGKDRVTVGWVTADALRSRPVSPEPEAEVAAINDRPKHYHFRLTQGPHVPVCEAYLQRLNQTLFHRQPYCGRPETDLVPGFEVLHRKRLSREEFAALDRDVSTLIYGQPLGSNWKPSYPASYAPSAWRYDPPVDIDNDGTADNVIIWSVDDVKYPLCGTPSGPNMINEHGAQRALVSRPDGQSVDVGKTNELFGLAGLSKADAAHIRNFNVAMSYQPIGIETGVFRFRNTTYYDTFIHTRPGVESAKQRRAGVRVGDEVGVFLRRDDVTRQVCEYVLLDSGDDQ